MKYTVYFIAMLLLLSGCREDSPDAKPTPEAKLPAKKPRIPTPVSSKAIEGLWEVESQDYAHGDLENKGSLLVFENGTFLCTAYEEQSRMVTRTHGGPYTFDGETLHLTFSFASESIEQSLGQTFTATVRFKDGKLYLSGYPDGVKFEEVWRRVQPTPDSQGQKQDNPSAQPAPWRSL